MSRRLLLLSPFVSVIRSSAGFGKHHVDRAFLSEIVQRTNVRLFSNGIQQSENKPRWARHENFDHSERKFQILTIEQYESLYVNDLDKKSKIEQILHKYELQKYTNQMVPTKLTVNDMRLLVEAFDDDKELDRTLKFFYTRECDKFNSKRKRLAKKQEAKARRIEKFGDSDEWQFGLFTPDGELIYGLWHNSLLSRITKQSVRDYRQNHMMRQVAMFGQKLIIDLDYDQYMKRSEASLLAQQIGYLFYENRINRDFPESLPFDVHFTNCHKAPFTMEALTKHIKRMDALIPYFHQASYLDRPEIFPKEKLVYLSPHARDPLMRYDHDDIYILGGYNDRSSHQHISHVKAQSEGIRCFRLPLDENVLWKQGNKNLCLNQVANILHAVKSTNDWQMAIRRFAPFRKIRSLEEQELEDQIRLRAIAKRLKNIERSYRLKSS